MHLPSGERSPDPGRLRLLALAGAVVCALALPLAMASAGPVGDADGTGGTRAAGAAAAAASGSAGRGRDDDRAPGGAGRTATALGLGLATAARCGPEVTSPGGVEAQTCVLAQGEETWARVYYRNTTGAALDAVLTLMGPADRTVRTRCATGADDEPAMCETPREPSRGRPAAYTAVSEFAAREGEGPLLLRSGSNTDSVADGGSQNGSAPDSDPGGR